MSAPPPIPMAFDGEVFRPLPRFHNIARAHYGEGEVVPLAPWEDRSKASHDHQFAWLNDAWQSLPEALAEQFPTPNHFRKRLLILAGFYKEDMVDAGTNAAALRVAAFMRSDDEFAHVVVRGPIVVRRQAKSQSQRVMGAAEFQRSKTAILELAAEMIGVEPATLSKQGDAHSPEPAHA